MKRQFHDEVDFFSFMTKMQEQLTALDKKVDFLMNKTLPQSVEARPPLKPAFPQPAQAQAPASPRPNNQHKNRPMHKATCADCNKECELPFKPSGDRPVYCKECFMKRKSTNTLKVATNNNPKEAPPVPAAIPAATHIPQPPAREKKKPSAAKRSLGKKKPALKKKK